jgi:hypothetical protein
MPHPMVGTSAGSSTVNSEVVTDRSIIFLQPFHIRLARNRKKSYGGAVKLTRSKDTIVVADVFVESFKVTRSA